MHNNDYTHDLQNVNACLTPRCYTTQITTWQGYDINGYRFHMKEKDKKSVTHNSGVRYEGIDKSMGEIRTYFRQIEEIWELDYGGDL